MTAFVLMGVSGAGKSTIGARVARELGIPFVEGDDYHPAENIAKMSSGVPLTDADRGPWIEALARALNARSEPDAIVACSALSDHVRRRLREEVHEPVEFVFLTADPAVIQERLERRPRHYMKAGMLGSQLAALQVPHDAEHVDVGRPLEVVTNDVAAYIRPRLQR
jgi:carbohydrate kinase (thermoresistant glucokinase family)